MDILSKSIGFIDYPTQFSFSHPSPHCLLWSLHEVTSHVGVITEPAILKSHQPWFGFDIPYRPRFGRLEVRDVLLDDLDIADWRVVDPVEVVGGADAGGGGHGLEGDVVEGHGAVAESLGVDVLASTDEWHGGRYVVEGVAPRDNICEPRCLALPPQYVIFLQETLPSFANHTARGQCRQVHGGMAEYVDQ